MKSGLEQECIGMEGKWKKIQLPMVVAGHTGEGTGEEGVEEEEEEVVVVVVVECLAYGEQDTGIEMLYGKPCMRSILPSQTWNMPRCG